MNTCVLLVLLVITLPLLHRRNRRHTPLIKVRLPCLKLGLIFNPGEQSQRHTLNATGVSTPRMDGGDYAAYAYCTWLHTSPRKFACAHVTVTIDALPRVDDLLCMAWQSDFLHGMQAAELETLNYWLE